MLLDLSISVLTPDHDHHFARDDHDPIEQIVFIDPIGGILPHRSTMIRKQLQNGKACLSLSHVFGVCAIAQNEPISLQLHIHIYTYTFIYMHTYLNTVNNMIYIEELS